MHEELCDDCHKRPAVTIAHMGFQFTKLDKKGKPIKATGKFEKGNDDGYLLCAKCLPKFKKHI